MEALAAFGVACNVMQVISFSKEAISLSLEIYKEGTSVDNHNLEQSSKEIKGLQRMSSLSLGWRGNRTGK